MEPIVKTASAWAQANPILAFGQKGIESDTGREKVGDGVSSWAPLNYLGGGSGVSIGQRYFLGCYGTNHNIAPNDVWNIQWNTDDAWTPEQAWPGSLNTSNLNALPSGIYVADFGVSLDGPLPKDVVAYLYSSAELADPPHFNAGSGQFFAAAGNSLNAFFEAQIMLLVPEDCVNLYFSVQTIHAHTADNSDSTPYVFDYAVLSLTKLA